MPVIPTFLKVTIPFTALTVVAPTVVAPVLTVIVTESVLEVTVLPLISLMVMTGWVENAEPLAAPAAGVEMASWYAGPGLVDEIVIFWVAEDKPEDAKVRV